MAGQVENKMRSDASRGGQADWYLSFPQSGRCSPGHERQAQIGRTQLCTASFCMPTKSLVDFLTLANANAAVICSLL